MKVYISGPMTGITDFNFPLFDTVRDGLIEQGHDVFSPADHDRDVIERLWPGKRPEDFDGYADGDITRYFDSVSHGGEFVLDNMMAWDLNMVVNEADAIVLLPGWERSSGGLAERYAAEAVGKQVFLWDADESGYANGWLTPDSNQQLLRHTLKLALTTTPGDDFASGPLAEPASPKETVRALIERFSHVPSIAQPLAQVEAQLS